ncbi:hypothetical protein BAUCODRAFT_33550 [Baudoinia panamericana UAMH 10762]|uniref:Uncharacterized protein n=1 Tax=Baudoinia panamericana (strain UAMH 10762) TaxID=717646 RepID=M2MHU2_BAUPA|nr:uncharacterized protein BAUCODRAFT_33550 [Baudoinia panamericana UAMH 10762]EMC96201.1 hypothetical protein BAUCODRAFT_33550 [Baudoinia panamericana UAMH 10762]
MDRFSPIAPVAIRVVVLPVGRIEAERFGRIVRGLCKDASIIKLSDSQSLFFDYTTAPPSDNEQLLSPYEHCRETQLVVGVSNGFSASENEEEQLHAALERLREQYPRVVHRHLLLLPQPGGGTVENADNVTRVARAGEDEEGLAFADALGSVASSFLRDFSAYASATQALLSIQTPLRPSRNLQRPLSLHSDEGRPVLNHTDSPQAAEVTSPVGENPSPPPSRSVRSPPPTPLEHVQQSPISRSDSRASTKSRTDIRPSSLDRVQSPHRHSQAAAPPYNAKLRGKARVGIVLGQVQLQSGQWQEALHTLTEHTQTARKLSDCLWYAKGLECIVVCLLLLSESGQDFQIPSICYPPADRNSSAHVQKLSFSQPADWRSKEAVHNATLKRLSSSLPELLKHILSLYEAGEGQLVLPTLALGEVKIRFCKLLTTLFHCRGELDQNTLNALITDSTKGLPKHPVGAGEAANIQRSDIASLAENVQRTDMSDMPIAEQVRLLAGVAAVLLSIDYKRREALVLREILIKLTEGLNQARKIGAAEAGVHPAASLSADTGALAISNIAAQSNGVKEMVENLAQLFGIPLGEGNLSKPSTDPANSTDLPVGRTVPTSQVLQSVTDELQGMLTMTEQEQSSLAFGSAVLKAEVISAILAFSEAQPDPQGVIRGAEALLKAVTPSAAIDTIPDAGSVPLSKEEQSRLSNTIFRTIGVSRHLGLEPVEGTYWDPFLVRGLVFPARSPACALYPFIRGSKANVVVSTNQNSGPINPLLYDPNASHRAAPATVARAVILGNQPTAVQITLQNTLEVSIDIESLSLVTSCEDRIQLKTQNFTPFKVRPSQLLKTTIAITSTDFGDFEINGCRIKVAGCHESTFRIHAKPYASQPDTLAKLQGLKALTPASSAQPSTTEVGTPVAVPASAIGCMPLIAIDSVSAAGSAIALLEGQMAEGIPVTVRNTTHYPAQVVSAKGKYAAVEGLVSDGRDLGHAGPVIQPGETRRFNIRANGVVGAANADIDIYYGAAPIKDSDKYFRKLKVPLRLTVTPVFHLSNPDVSSDDASHVRFAFDIRNTFSQTMQLRCYSAPPPELVRADVEGMVASLDVVRICLRVQKGRKGEDLRESLARKVVVGWEEMRGERYGKVDLGGLVTSLTDEQVALL